MLRRVHVWRARTEQARSVENDPGATVGPGDARSPGDAAALARFESKIRLPLVLAAVVPLIVVPQSGLWFPVVVGVVSWVVFVVDYVVNVRHRVRYRKTALGRFDLVVVIVTAPWFLLPGAQAGSFVVVLRLARLARIVMASRGARRLLERLGRVAVVAVAVVLTASVVAYRAEHATNPGFATLGDAFWWGIVTLTTVGYGDIVPHTSTGRWAGVVIMLTGVTVLGVLAGSLASFFHLDPPDDDQTVERGAVPVDPADPTPSPPATAPATAADENLLQTLVEEMTALRTEVARLSAQLTSDDRS
jgi:voltage-gated potassium channel